MDLLYTYHVGIQLSFHQQFHPAICRKSVIISLISIVVQIGIHTPHPPCFSYRISRPDCLHVHAPGHIVAVDILAVLSQRVSLHRCWRLVHAHAGEEVMWCRTGTPPPSLAANASCDRALVAYRSSLLDARLLSLLW